MKVMIIEDEQMAQANLARKLKQNYSDIEIIGTAASVRESMDLLKKIQPDLIFMDVELSDGICFEIFRQIEVKAAVIMTTAYDNYAVKAFEQGSIDYLLKPVENDALERAVSRARSRLNQPDWAGIVTSLQQQIRGAQTGAGSAAGKERYLVRFNDMIIPVKISEVAYFYSEDKSNFLMTTAGNCYVVDASLDEIAADLDNGTFFKISRSCIVSLKAIVSITKQLGGRLKITASPAAPFEMTVSRSRCEDFIAWLSN